MHVDAVVVAQHGRTTGERGVHAFGTAERDGRVIELGRCTGPVDIAGDAHVHHFAVLSKRCPQVARPSWSPSSGRQTADDRWTAANARRKNSGRSSRCGGRPRTPMAVAATVLRRRGHCPHVVRARVKVLSALQVELPNEFRIVLQLSSDNGVAVIEPNHEFGPEATADVRTHCLLLVPMFALMLLLGDAPEPIGVFALSPETALPKSRPSVYRCGRIRSGDCRFFRH